MLSVVRNLPKASKSALSYKWREVEDEFRGIELIDKKLGIIGYGRIGSNVARYANAMGISVGAFDPYKEIDSPVIKYSSHLDLLKNSDIVLIAVHLDSSTENMVDSSWFNSMKDGVFFINVSRGEIVVEEDLIHALESRKIKSAGLDVIRNEISSELKSSKVINYAKDNDNLVITPHIAGLTVDSERKAAEFSLDILRKSLKGNK